MFGEKKYQNLNNQESVLLSASKNHSMKIQVSVIIYQTLTLIQFHYILVVTIVKNKNNVKVVETSPLQCFLKHALKVRQGSLNALTLYLKPISKTIAYSNWTLYRKLARANRKDKTIVGHTFE